jgi:hypothetical protein
LENKKRREHCSKIELVLQQKIKKKREIEAAKKKTDLGEREGRVYVL